MEEQTFGERLKTAREQRHLTRVQLAEQIGSSSKTIARWERGETLPQPQFHQKLCAVLNTTPQELGLETTIVVKKQEVSHSQQRSSSPPTPVTPSVPEPKQRTGVYIFILDCSCSLHSLHMGTGLQSYLIGTARNDQLPFIPGSSLRGSLQLEVGRTRSGKSTAISAFIGLSWQKRSQESALPVEVKNVLNSPRPGVLSAKDIGDKALYGFFRGKVFLLAQAGSKKHIDYVAKNLDSVYQYAIMSGIYTTILPNFFTVLLQIDIGGIVTSMSNVVQTIHQVLSDPSWQGIGVVISIVLPLIMGYKKKSSMDDPLFAPLALAA